MKVVFWFFQFVFAFTLLSNGAYYLENPTELRWNWALVAIYVILQIALWLGYYLLDKKDDVFKLLSILITFDVIVGSLGAVIYSAVAGAANTGAANHDWIVFRNAMYLVVATIVLGNAPTAAALFFFGSGSLPQIKSKKKVKKHIVDRE